MSDLSDLLRDASCCNSVMLCQKARKATGKIALRTMRDGYGYLRWFLRQSRTKQTRQAAAEAYGIPPKRVHWGHQNQRRRRQADSTSRADAFSDGRSNRVRWRVGVMQSQTRKNPRQASVVPVCPVPTGAEDMWVITRPMNVRFGEQDEMGKESQEVDGWVEA